jgi:hypothetical protein
MAIFKTGPIVGGISGSVGGVTFTNAKQGGNIRLRPIKTEKQSVYNQTARAAYARTIRAWRSLTDTQRTAWRTAATTLPTTNRLGQFRALSGFQLYCKIGLLQYQGNPPAGLMPPPTLAPIAPELTSVYAFSNGVIGSTSSGAPWPTSAITEHKALARFLGSTQTSGISTWRRLGSFSKAVATHPIENLVNIQSNALVPGERFAIGTRWGTANSIPSFLSWAMATVDAVPVVVDNFTRMNLTPWTQTGTYYIIDTSTYLSAPASVRCGIPAGGSLAASLISTAGLAHYPIRGTTLSFRIRLANTPLDTRLIFMQNPTNSYYLLQHLHAVNQLNFYRVVLGVQTHILQIFGAITHLNEWLQYTIAVGLGGTITIRYLRENGTQITTGSVVDTTHNQGGIQTVFYNVAGSVLNAYVDDIAITGAAA